jgi:hypothetical protein
MFRLWYNLERISVEFYIGCCCASLTFDHVISVEPLNHVKLDSDITNTPERLGMQEKLNVNNVNNIYELCFELISCDGYLMEKNEK